MVTVLYNLQMEIIMKEILKMEYLKGKENFNGKMDHNILDNLRMEKNKEKDNGYLENKK